MLRLTQQNARFLALAVVALGFALRLYTLASESLWYDELLQLDIAQGPLRSLLPRLRGHTGVPLDYLITHFWILGGHSDGWVRLPAVIWGTLTLPLTYQLGQRMIGPGAGLLLLALLALSPFHVQYSQEVRPYALGVLGVVLTVYGFWQLRHSGRWRYLIPLQLGVLVSWLAHIFTLPIWSALVTFAAVEVVLDSKRRHRAQTLIGLVVTALVALAVLLMLGWGDILFYNTQGFGQALVQPEQFAPEASQVLTGGRAPQVTWLFVRNEIIAPLGATDQNLAGLWLFNGLVGLGLVSLFVQKRAKPGLLLLVWLLLPPVVIVIFLITRDEFFASRYIIFLLPAYLMLLTAGLLAGSRWLKFYRSGWLLAVVLLILSGIVIVNLGLGLSRLYHKQDKEDWRLVADFIASNANSNDAIIAFHAEPTINWYYPPAWAAPNSFENLEIIQQTVVNARRAWIILSLFSSDTDAAVKAWLSEQQAVRFVLDPIIQVYYLGYNVPHEQLLAEIEGFALPVDHALYASLARENRRRPEIARQYYRLAIEHAPNDDIRAAYQAALEKLPR